MPKKAPVTSTAFVWKQLDDYLREIAAAFNSDAITLNAALVYGVETVVRDVVEAIDEKKNKLSVILTTGGGYIEVVQRIVDTLRHHYEQVEFVIPNYALSAGTVLAMSGDAIHMDYFSVLGPIDPQVPGANGSLVPALGYLAQYDRFVAKSALGQLTTAEMAFFVQKFDPGELYRYEQARELTVSLLKEWLVKYKFKNWNVTETAKQNVTSDMKVKRAEEIAHMLNRTEQWHSHGRGIPMSVLSRDLKLLIDDYGKKPDLATKLRCYHELLVDHMAKQGSGSIIHAIEDHNAF